MTRVFENIYEREELKGDLITAFRAVDDILIDHSGPFATDCVIGSKWRQTNDVDEQTKDGIKILLHLIVSEDAAARFAVRMTRFVGIAVDKRCHDGTTTSMLLFCRLAVLALSQMDTDIFSRERFRWVQALGKAFEECLSKLESLKITEDDLFKQLEDAGKPTRIEDVRASLAYHMAMISSKGDHDLSFKISEIIRSSPKKIYGIFKDTPLAVETGERYHLKKQEYDLAVDANIGNFQDYNYKNDSQYMTENAVIFATGNDIAVSSMESIFLNAFISTTKTNPRLRMGLQEFGEDMPGWDELHEGKKNLIIMTPMLNDPGLIETINIFNANNPTIKISWFNVQIHPRLRTSLNKTLHFMAGRPLFYDVMTTDSVASLIGLDHPVKAHLVGHMLTLSNMYEKTGDVFHPFYDKPDIFPPYTKFREETEELIEFANQNISNASLDSSEVAYLTSLYRALTTQDIYDIEIGGSAHDQYANRTVYEDSIGAALSAVNDGVVLGGYFQLARQMNPDNKVETAFRSIFLRLVEDSLRVKPEDSQTRDLMETEGYDKWTYVAADRDAYLSDGLSKAYIGKHRLAGDFLDVFLAREPSTPILFQAWTGYHEQFRRFKDIIPKLANTTHLADMRIQQGSDVR